MTGRRNPWTPNEVWEKSIPEPNTGCWLWLSELTSAGYGRASVPTDGVGGYVTTRAHRMSYEVHVGPLLDGMEIHHKCRMRCCVNPDHLIQLTVAEHRRIDNKNAALAGLRPRKKSCVHGHPYEPNNRIIYLDKNGSTHRTCRICSLLAQARYRASKKK